jgi:hypothetical protein
MHSNRPAAPPLHLPDLRASLMSDVCGPFAAWLTAAGANQTDGRPVLEMTICKSVNEKAGRASACVRA